VSSHYFCRLINKKLLHTAIVNWTMAKAKVQKQTPAKKPRKPPAAAKGKETEKKKLRSATSSASTKQTPIVSPLQKKQKVDLADEQVSEKQKVSMWYTRLFVILIWCWWHHAKKKTLFDIRRSGYGCPRYLWRMVGLVELRIINNIKISQIVASCFDLSVNGIANIYEI